MCVGLQDTNGGLVVFAGGVPIKSGGKFLGAVGVSGGTADMDSMVAEAAGKALEV